MSNPLFYYLCSLPHTKVSITNSFKTKVNKIYVHKNYNNWTRDGDISILELESAFHPEYTYPAVLPQAPLDLHHGKLHVAFNEGNQPGATFLQKVNASIWSNDECAPDLDHKIVIKENLLCIEVTDACDHLLVKHSIIMFLFFQDNHLIHITE